MRNIFDQYDQFENRLTHALLSSLDADRALLGRFLSWITGEKHPAERLHVLEQTLPGEEYTADEGELERRGLPDGCIHDDESGWTLFIESKIESPLSQNQLDRHLRTAEKRGVTNARLLALVVDVPESRIRNEANLTLRKWTELYSWLRRNWQSEWSRRVASYMEVLEQKMIKEDYLRAGTLTVFTGIPFGKDEPYSYYEAKRLMKLAMDQLRERSDLKQELGMDPGARGRSAITGRESTRVWDFLRLIDSEGAENFTEFPHLTLSIQQEQLIAIVTVPHGIRREFRNNLIAGGREEFCEVFERILKNFNACLAHVEGCAPWVELVQRRYPTQRSEPIIDARLQFDLRTGFAEARQKGNSVKQQPQWLEAAYEALENKNSNLQLGVGAIFRYERCPAVSTPEILDHVANVWLTCKPLIQRMIKPELKRHAVGA